MDYFLMLINNNRVKKFQKKREQVLRQFWHWISKATIIYKENVSVVTEGLQKIFEIIFRPVGAQKPLNRPKNMQKLFWASAEIV